MTENAKKWFVHYGDRQEGPVPLDKVGADIAEGKITPKNFVWCEGMKEWKSAAEVEALQTFFQAPMPPSFAAPPAMGASPPSLSQQPFRAAPQENSSDLSALLDMNTRSNEPTATLDVKKLREVKKEAAILEKQAKKSAAPLTSARGAMEGSKKRIVVVGLVLVIGLAVLAQFGPAIRSMVSTYGSAVGTLKDVTPEDLQELKSVIAMSDKGGTKAALALSTNDLDHPTFYVASNGNETQNFEIYVHGDPKTLVNRKNFESHVSVSTLKHLGTGQPFKGESVTPAGEYQVVLVNDGDGKGGYAPAFIPKGKKVLATKALFLGGKKDANYDAALKKYHNGMREAGVAEISALKVMIAQIDSKYDFLRQAVPRITTPPVLNQFKTQWTKYASETTIQIAQTGQKVEAYFPMLRTNVQSLWQAEDKAVMDTADPKLLPALVTDFSAKLAAIKGQVDIQDKKYSQPDFNPMTEGLK